MDESAERPAQERLIPGLLELVEKRLDSHEQMLAAMLTQMGELWCGLEALIEAVLDGKPKEEREIFRKALSEWSSQLWQAISEQYKLAGNQDPSPGAVEDSAP